MAVLRPVGAPAAVQTSLDQLGTPLIETRFCVIDLETTGTDRHNDMITEVGAAIFEGGDCLGTFQTLINPGRAIPPTITMLTGLTDALVATAPRIEAVLPSLLEFIGSSVIVGHNVGFDLGFLNAALERSQRPRLDRPTIDTVPLARRLVRSEVRNCRLGTLAETFGLAHQPSHRALDDVLATADLLHLLIERAAGLGVLGLDDLISFAQLARHPQSAKLSLTNDLPRSPGVYMFRGPGDEILYIGKATNLRQRVRSYFGSDERRKVGALLRQTASLSHVELPDPLTADIIERRMIIRHTPRYNQAGTRTDRYCYIRLDTGSPWPRLSCVRSADTGGTTTDSVHLGPLPSRRQATLIIEAIESVVGLRRCSTRIGRRYQPAPDAIACSSAQLGVAACPCAGLADPVAYQRDVERVASLFSPGTEGGEAMTGFISVLTDKMTSLSTQQRFEDAAAVRDRLSALVRAVYRHQIVERLRRAGRVRITDETCTWTIDGARLIDVSAHGGLTASLPVPPPTPPEPDALLRPDHIDEALCLARFIDHGSQQGLHLLDCTGTWEFPSNLSDRLIPTQADRELSRAQSATG
jgi:DNA polymerase-3 subunit epsilon